MYSECRDTATFCNYNDLVLKAKCADYGWNCPVPFCLIIWLPKRYPHSSSCFLIVPEIYPVDNIWYAFLIVQNSWHLYFITHSHCCGYYVINIWHSLGSWGSVPRGIWWYIFPSCIFCQLNKGHLSGTSVKATYTRVIMCIMVPFNLPRVILLKDCSEHIL